jgi:hypothetical protein
MKQKINISIYITLFIILVPIITAEDTHATVRLFDSKVILNGYVKEVAFYRTAMKDRDEKYHDSKFDFLKTSAGIEALLKIFIELSDFYRCLPKELYWCILL